MKLIMDFEPRRMAGRCGLATAALLTAILIAEGILRLPVGSETPPDSDPAGQPVLPMIPDPEVGWILPADTTGVHVSGASRTSVRTDSRGLRAVDQEEGAQGAAAAAGMQAAALLVLGDSYAFGWGVPADTAFPAHLAVALRTRLPDRPAVINAALPGYSVYQQRRMLQRVLFGADIGAVVATISLANDPVDELRIRRFAPDRLDAYDPSLEGPGSRRAAWVRGSRLLGLLEEKTRTWRFARLNARRESEDLMLESLRGLAADCRQAGLPLLWLVVPRVAEVRADEPAGRMDRRAIDVAGDLRRRVEILAENERVAVLDLYPALSRAEASGAAYLPDDPHWSAAGHRAVAEAILPVLLDLWTPADPVLPPSD